MADDAVTGDETIKPSEKKNTTSRKTNDADNIERLREKKRLKKQRQKGKREAARKEEAKAREDSLKLEEENSQFQIKEKERKMLEKRAPSVDQFVPTHHEGVKYCDVMVGKGPVIQDRKKVTCKYVLRAKHKKGKIIDSGSNFSFQMGKGEVIKGWEIGLLKMREGGIRHILVASSAGYGNQDIGAGKGSDLYFEVTLLQC